MSLWNTWSTQSNGRVQRLRDTPPPPYGVETPTPARESGDFPSPWIQSGETHRSVGGKSLRAVRYREQKKTTKLSLVIEDEMEAELQDKTAMIPHTVQYSRSLIRKDHGIAFARTIPVPEQRQFRPVPRERPEKERSFCRRDEDLLARPESRIVLYRSGETGQSVISNPLIYGTVL